MSVDMNKHTTLELEVLEVVERLWPGTVNGELIPHAEACASLATVLGGMLVWRLIKGDRGDESLVDAINHIAETMYAAAHSKLKLAEEIKKAMPNVADTQQ
jgi:hypothetical protein